MKPSHISTTIALILVQISYALSADVQQLERRDDQQERRVGFYEDATSFSENLLSRDEHLADSEDIKRASIDSREGKDSTSAGKVAPVDGKDGRPHAGPWVETNADRDRKKSKEKWEESLPAAGRKPQPKEASDTKGHDTTLPSTNDGVMDDPNREEPKEGTRGTEGGISEKYRQQNLEHDSGKPIAKTPSEPKEAPPLPHSEQEKLSESLEKSGHSKSESQKDAAQDDADEDDLDRELGGLKKPEDLPSKPHAIPHPLPNSNSKEDALAFKPTTPSSEDSLTDANGLIQPLHSFALAFTMIVFSEIGDKTFLIAALMAMKHPPLLVLSAAFPALLTMTILSAVLGHALPTLLPVRFTGFLASILFLVFGLKLLREGYAMRPEEGVGEEMREVEMELEEKEQMARKYNGRRGSINAYALEAGRGTRKSRSNSRLPAPPDSPPSSPDARSPSPSRQTPFSSAFVGISNLCSFLLSPVWVQTFAMTFLGEWGDRSQIATIAMAAGQDYWWVTTGALVGHFLCTAIAVVGGRAIAGRVSMRVVTIGGAFAFLAFGIVYLAESLYYQ